jgi:ribosomal protein L40E
MSGGFSTHQSGAAVIDADAVCEVCGTVNPEGTLICRTCGNNLRDQKSKRMAADVQLLEPERVGGSQFVKGGLALLGLLVVAWVAVNVNRIADAVINAGAPDDPIVALFESPENATFQLMLDEAAALAPTFEQVDALRAAPLVADTPDGRYALAMGDGYGSFTVVGVGVVQTDPAGRIRYVASVGNAGHARGYATRQGLNAFGSPWNEAAAQDSTGQIYAVSGVAVTQQDGSVECFGQSFDEASYDVVAFRLP